MWERLILTHGLQTRSITQTSKPWKPKGDTLTCPLFGSRELCHTKIRCTLVWKIGWKFKRLLSETTKTTKTHHHASLDHHYDRPISSTYPASQNKTAISRAEAQKIAEAAAAEKEEAGRRAAAHQRRAIPQVRPPQQRARTPNSPKHPTAATRSRVVRYKRDVLLLCFSLPLLFVSCLYPLS